MKTAQQTGDCRPLVEWLEDELPTISHATDNPETMPLEVVSYLELIPETEA